MGAWRVRWVEGVMGGRCDGWKCDCMVEGVMGGGSDGWRV